MTRRILRPDSLSAVSQQYVLPGVVPGALPPFDVGGHGEPEPRYMVADELIRCLPFVSSAPGGHPYSEQYVVRADGPLQELPIATVAAGTAWRPGASFSFEQPLDGRGSRRRFKRFGAFIQIDELMVDESGRQPDVLELETRLAAVSLVRSLSSAVLQSSPKQPRARAADGSNLADPDVQEFTGLPASIAGTGQDVAWGETQGLLDGLSAIEALCHPSDGDFGSQPDAFVMSSRARWRLLRELEQCGVTPDFRMSSLTGKIQFHFHGVPVISGRVREMDDEITEAWALKLHGPTGVRMLHIGGDPDAYGVQIEETLVSESAPEPAGTVTVQKGVEVFGIFSLVVPELQSAARLSAIPVGPPKGKSAA